jgi:hypothetical protein
VEACSQAAWETVKTASPTEILPVRADPVFCATLNVTVPEPEPDPPEVTVTQDDDGVAAHEQLEEASTWNERPLAPAPATVVEVGWTKKEQCTPAWCTGTVISPIWIDPDRADRLLLAATLKETLPFPDPWGLDVSVIHESVVPRRPD